MANNSKESAMDKVKETVSTFNKYASQYQEKYMSYAPYVESYGAFAKLLTKKHCTILDVACGPGNFSRYLLNVNPNLKITGLDLAPDMIELARQNVPAAEFHLLDSRDIASLGKKFDVILLGFCLPYLSREESALLLTDIGKMINKNGLLYLSTIEGEYSRSGYQSNNSKDRMFVYYHSLNYLIEQLVTNGFEIVHAEKVSFPSDNDSGIDDLFLFARARK